MKKIITLFLSTMMVFSLAGCTSKPSDEKIKTALEEGTITFDDAKAKGWINDEWIKANFDQLEAGSKIHLFDPFETTYLDGTPASSNLIAGKMCLVFFNTQQEKTLDQLQVFSDVSEEMESIGIPVMGIVTDEDVTVAQETLTDMKFPILVYNDEMQKSLSLYKDMINTDLVFVFTKEGGFYTAWNSNPVAEDLLSFAKALANEE